MTGPTSTGVVPIGVYTANVELAPHGLLTLTVYVSTDHGPAYVFRPCLEATLDEDHGTELLGTLALALQDLRESRVGRIER